MKKIPLRTKITLTIAGLSQSRPGLGRNNENTRKTKSKISGYILRSTAGLLLFSCVIVALSSAIAYVNGDCMPNDYTITTGSGTMVHGISDTGNHCDDCITPIALPFPVTFYDQTFFSVGISSNGNLQFTGANESDFGNACPPTGTVIDLIAPFWADLHDEDT